MKNKVIIIQGPNLNMLGLREPSLYGNKSLENIHDELINEGKKIDLEVKCFQSNHEGEIIEAIQQSKDVFDFIIINAAAYTHTSVAIRDALLSVKLPAIEVHISNIYAREGFRHKSLLADIVIGQICGLGIIGYQLALQGAAHIIEGGRSLG